VHSTNTENIVTHITGSDFNALFPSGYSSILNEMIEYTGNKILNLKSGPHLPLLKN
jgi:hypothetical protein